ncbi:MAG: TetR/AcrR family transcriptional regulator [Salinisphaeraceae bacterium]
MPRAPLSNREIERARQQLCDAALTLYREQGFEAVTFRRLAERMGTSHTRPYHYFDSKETLFAAVRLGCYQRFAALIRERDVPAADPATRLRSIYCGILDYVSRNPAEYQLMFAADQAPLRNYAELLSARRQAFDYLVDIVSQATDAGLIDGDPRDIMHVGWGAVHGLLTLHTAGQLLHGRRLEALTEPLLRRVFHPLFEADHHARRSA